MIRNIAMTTAALLVFGALAAVPTSAQAPTDGVAFHYMLEDDQGDEGPQCANGYTTGLDSPCDIWTFEAGNTADLFVFRFTQATMNYGPAAAASELNPRFAFADPAGNEYRAHVAINAGGDIRTVSFSSDQGPPPDDIQWAVDQDAGTITAWFPLESLEDAGPGAVLEVLEISTAWALEGQLFWTNRDTVADVPPVEIVSAGPALVEEFVEGGEFSANLTFEEPTNGTYLYHWNHTLNGSVEASYAADLVNGSISVLVLDATNATHVDATIAGAANESIVREGVTPGNWTLRLNVTDAVGDFSFRIVAHSPPVEETPGPDLESAGNETTPAGNATGLNETEEAGIGIPGFEAPAILAGLFAAVAIGARRRRA